MSDKKEILRLVSAACAGLLMLVCVACSDDELSADVIASCDNYVLTGDSLICDGYYVTAISPYQIVSSADSVAGWELASPVAHVPQFVSNELMITALYNHALSKLANYDWRNLSTAQLSAAVSLAMVYVNPKQAIGLLQTRVHNGIIVNDGDGFLGWAFAAWEAYKATGNKQWLTYAYQVVKATVARDYEWYFDSQTSLMRGDVPQGELSTTHSHFEKWMSMADAFDVMPLAKNTFYCVAYDVLAQMGEELSVPEDEVASYATSCQILKDAINQNLWNEGNGYYSSFLYSGRGSEVRSSGINMVAQALNVMWNIADDGRAETLVSHTPLADEGVTTEYFANEDLQCALRPDALAQVLMAVAAAKAGNHNVLRRSIGAITYNTVREGLASPSALAALANVAVVMKVLLGIEFHADGIEFNPVIPHSMKAKKVLTQFKYRGATLSVTVVGTGEEVQSVSIDGKRCEGNFLPATITGNHTITVVMQSANNATQKVTRVRWNKDIAKTVIKKSMLANPPKINYEDEMKFACSNSVDNTSEMGPIQSVNVHKGGAYLLRVFYAADTTIAIKKVPFAKVIVNTHKQAVVVLPAQKNNADSLFSNSVKVELLKGENTIGLKFPDSQPQNIVVKEMRVLEKMK